MNNIVEFHKSMCNSDHSNNGIHEWYLFFKERTACREKRMEAVNPWKDPCHGESVTNLATIHKRMKSSDMSGAI